MIQTLPSLQTAALEGDVERSVALTEELQDHADSARSAGTDPVWKAAGLIPFVGQNFTAVSEVAVSADDVMDRAVAPLVRQFDSLDWDSLTPRDGRIDVTPLEEVSPTLTSASNTLQLSYERLNGIDRSRLLPQISEPLQQAVDAMDDARQALSSAAAAAEVLPPMLGADGPRTYMVLIQNSAEIRATGGIPGAYALIRTDGGAIELVGQGSATEMGRFNPPLDVDPQQAQIYSSRLGGFLQSANLTPDFPTVAQTAKAMYEERNEGQRVDGVLAMDAVVLSKLLGVTGPVELDDIDDPLVEQLISQTALPEFLNTDNVVDTLLSDVYSEIEEPEFQDIYFAAVAGEVFSTLSEGAGDNAGLIDALTQSTEEHRLYLWSNVSDEQAVIASTQLAGAATGPTKGGASFGVYFNDGTGAKMDYYVERTVELIQSCSPDDVREYTAQVTLTNTAPADAATSLPRYVTGGAVFGVPEGHVRTNVVAYGPAQAAVAGARIDGAEVPLGSFLHGNRPVGVVTTELAPGESVTVDLAFTNVVQTDDPVLSVTPTIQPVSDVVQPTQVDASCG
ncbi:DUF4012 domain-containing protein [Arthrobacter sp. RIT-PI-e]|uniref:DUF4012 domain-containing protein n=1 Tax=Arthrobacter sp. RIT-PI-e TaxID=1681197 RepID=UPI001F195245|nr:DUF4012 domain-containing protein [Arthrobacter sp. RIT-PI-e]